MTSAGWKTLAICGLKAGEEVHTERVDPSATTWPVAMTMVRSVVAAANSTSWVASRTAAGAPVAPAAMSLTILASSFFMA